MKFGKNFSFYKIPEFSEYYFDYNSVKLFLSFIDRRRSRLSSLKKLQRLKQHKISANDIDIRTVQHNELMELNNDDLDIKNKKSFKKANSSNVDFKANNLQMNQSMKDKEIDKEININSSKDNNSILEKLDDTSKLENFIKFYSEKVKVVDDFFILKLNEFIDKFDKIKEQISDMKMNKDDDSESKNNKHHDGDEFGYATSWKRALSSLYIYTSWLHSYHNINLLAIQKIQKKSKKILKKHNIKGLDKEFSKTDNNFKFFLILDTLVELRVNIKKFYAQQFTDNDLQKARKELHKGLIGSKTIKPISYFYFGVIISFIIFYIFLCFNNKIRINSVKPFFPAFNFSLVIILAFFGVALNLYILKKFKINYLYIFEVEPKLRLGSTELLEFSLFLLLFWCIFMLCAKIVYNYTTFGNNYYIFPLLIIIFLFIFLLIPFNFMYYDFRKGIVKTFIRNLFPFGKKGVRFRDFVFGDILTSLTKPLCSLALTFCLIGNKGVREDNKRIDNCNRDTIYCFIILLYPNFIRFTQCINRLYYTKNLWPHFFNLLKYTGGIINVTFTWLYVKKDNKTFLILYIIIAFIVNLYQLFWDVYVDWGLGRINSKNFFLRDTIVYPKEFYYICIILDALIRYSWICSFIHLNKKKYDEWVNLFMAIIEIYRRIQWCIIRIENENTTNPEKYRAILTIPEIPEF